MPPTLADAYHLPTPDELRAAGFVVKLSRRVNEESEAAQRLVREYVLTPTVEKALPKILGEMRQVFDRGEEYGRLIHGSFGSGKSHFLSILGLLLENSDLAWAKDAEAIRDLREHRAWLAEANLLVVRAHMLSLRGKETGLDDALYQAFNDTLCQHGKKPFAVLDVDGVIAEVEREAELYGEKVWRSLEAAGIVGSREEFRELDAEEREDFARQYLELKGRSAASAGLDPVWAEGVKRMAEHAREQGFGGLVFLIDEFLLWLAEKSGEDFAREIHDLNLLVDHATGRRAVPTYAFVARQRNIREFFPDLVGEDKIEEHLKHHAQRFEITELKDVELRHIVKGRVLVPRDRERIEREINELIDEQRDILPGLLANADIAYLRDVYPFHPALIETLVDVSALLQRERSALRLLYELLDKNRDRPLRHFLPAGSAFDVIFPEEGVEASESADTFREIHRQYHQRLVPAMDAMVVGEEIDATRRRALDQLVKTVLLAEISPRLRGAGLTVERLVQLNEVDVTGATSRSQRSNAFTGLSILSRHVPELQISGQREAAVVRFVLDRVTLSDYLERARSKDNKSAWMRAFLDVLKPLLGLADRRGFEGSLTPLSGDYRLAWRRTDRVGTVQIGNVRETRYDDFLAPAGRFRILIDYPWDEPGRTVEEDRLRARNARKERGNQYTLCWLPRHLGRQELDTLRELCAVDFLLSGEGQEELLRDLGAKDRQELLHQAETRRHALRQAFEEIVREIYGRHAEIEALTQDLDVQPTPELAESLERFARQILDRRYPSHPQFAAKPTRRELELVLEWMRRANEAGGRPVDFDAETGKALGSLAQPLEIVQLGQTRGTLRLDSRFLKEVLRRADQPRVRWAEIADPLRETHGFQDEVLDLFLAFLCSRGFRALHEATGEAVEVGIGGRAKPPLVLERAELLEPAAWSKMRELGEELFACERPQEQRSLGVQDRFAATLRHLGRDRRALLQDLHERLDRLDVAAVAPRREELREAIRRLAPLERDTADSYAVLRELDAAWPGEAGERIRRVVARAATWRDALDELDPTARSNLLHGRDDARLGVEIGERLAELERLLAGHDSAELKPSAISRWNRTAQELVRRLIDSKVTTDGGDGSTEEGDDRPRGDEPGDGARVVMRGEPLEIEIDGALDAFLGKLARRLEEAGGRLRVDVTVRREEET